VVSRNRKYRSWIPGIVFWILFLGSIAFGRRFRWVDTIWNLAWLLLLFVIAVCATFEIFRNRHKAGGYVGYRGVPRWVVTFFGGEVKDTKAPETPLIVQTLKP
jgi:hypothetical protein